MGLFDFVGSTATDALQESLRLFQDRHRVLADNVANIDTPGYRMKDIDTGAFEGELARAITKSRRANPNASRLEFAPPDPRSPSAQRIAGIVFHDDNNRSVERLMAEMAKNGSKHAQAASVLRNQVNLLRAVISENA